MSILFGGLFECKCLMIVLPHYLENMCMLVSKQPGVESFKYPPRDLVMRIKASPRGTSTLTRY